MSRDAFILACYEQGIFTQKSILDYLHIRSFRQSSEIVDKIINN